MQLASPPHRHTLCNSAKQPHMHNVRLSRLDLNDKGRDRVDTGKVTTLRETVNRFERLVQFPSLHHHHQSARTSWKYLNKILMYFGNMCSSADVVQENATKDEWMVCVCVKKKHQILDF